MSTDPPASALPPRPSAELAQLLATEHWSLLATRSMTWSEIMSRITIHLAVTSASLVALALVSQATDLGGALPGMAIGLTAAVLVMGTMTSLRVTMAGNEDAALVRAMNRLRAAYVQLAPEIEPFLTASIHDDVRGLMHTYAMGERRRMAAHVVGSTAFFLAVVNALVAGALGALVAATADVSPGMTSLVGAASAIAYLLIQLEVGRRTYSSVLEDVRFPSA